MPLPLLQTLRNAKLTYSMWTVALDDWNEAMLNGPSQENLSGCTFYFTSYALQYGIFHSFPSNEWAVGLYYDVLSTTVVHYIALCKLQKTSVSML